MVKDDAKDASPRAELKEKVILEAQEAFREHGIKSVRMDDIANSLRMSKRTLYELFQDKETLLEECILHHRDCSQKELEKIVRKSRNVLEVILECYKGSIEIYHKTNKKFFEDIKRYPKVYDLIVSDKEEDSVVVIEFLKRGVDQGIFRKDINYAIIHALLSEQMELLMSSSVCTKFSFLEVYESIIFTYLRGVSTAEGAKELEDFICEYRKEQIYHEETPEK